MRNVAMIYLYIYIYPPTGFPKKDARFPKIKNIPALLSDDEEG